MASVSKPLMGRGSSGANLSGDIAYDCRRKIGAYIREQRLKAGMTQEELAKHLDMGHTAISAMEHGRSTISPERYADIASLFGLDEREFGIFLLQFTNPWLHTMIFGEGTRAERQRLASIPTRIGVRKD